MQFNWPAKRVPECRKEVNQPEKEGIHMILAFIKMNVRPEKHKELLQTFQSIVAQMRKENGCVDSNFYRNAENENDFLG
jgi:hypothetical protein